MGEIFESLGNGIAENSQRLYHDMKGLEQHTNTITILKIDTEEGVLDPLGVGEITIEVRY